MKPHVQSEVWNHIQINRNYKTTHNEYILANNVEKKEEKVEERKILNEKPIINKMEFPLICNFENHIITNSNN